MNPLLVCPRHKPGLEIEDTGDELLIHKADLDNTYYLNGTAALVWRLCDGNRSGAEIVDLLADAYSDEAESVRDQVPGILNELIEQAVVEIA